MPDIFEPLHRKSPIAELPTPAAYRRSTPAVLTPPTEGEAFKRADRRLWLIGLLIVVALHVAAGLLWWLTPKMRLKSDPAPEQWVQISPIPPPGPAAPTVK